MERFTTIIFILASGPAIASPTVERFDLTRSRLNDVDAASADQLIAEVDFSEPSGLAAQIKAADGRHKSNLKVDMADGRTLSLNFVTLDQSDPLRRLTDFIQMHGEKTQI